MVVMQRISNVALPFGLWRFYAAFTYRAFDQWDPYVSDIFIYTGKFEVGWLLFYSSFGSAALCLHFFFSSPIIQP
jgi:hypothetical protein